MLTKSKFRPAWWLRNPHAQTLWAAKVHPAPCPVVSTERLTTSDNDFVDLSWTTGSSGPVVVIFHGLTGSIKSRYIRSIMSTLHAQNYLCVLMHFRGCSGVPNRTSGAYHSGHTVDIELIVNTLAQRFHNEKLIAIGYSLGGNALLKYLSQHKKTPLSHAIAVCPPLLLAEGARRISRGFSKLYQWTLISQMKAALALKHSTYPELGIDQFNYQTVKNFFSWDDQITAPLHGFDSADDYYNRCSTLHDLRTITTNTHVIFSRDDPFFTDRCIPADNSQLSKQVTFEIASGAGHVGFISGSVPGFGRDWLRDRVAELVSA